MFSSLKIYQGDFEFYVEDVWYIYSDFLSKDIKTHWKSNDPDRGKVNVLVSISKPLNH